MSGFAPNPLQISRDREITTTQTYRHVLRRIASGEAKNPQVEAKVALGQLPIAALLEQPDSEVFCVKCKNKGRTTRGQGANAGQRFGCPGCGYLEGEHPNEGGAS